MKLLRYEVVHINARHAIPAVQQIDVATFKRTALRRARRMRLADPDVSAHYFVKKL